MNDLPLPTDWDPSWNRTRDMIASHIAKKRVILKALNRLEHDRPETFIVKEGAFTMNIASRLIDNKALLRLRQKARKLSEDKPPRVSLPSYPHAQRTIDELEQAAVQIYGTAAHSRLLWQLQHAADLGLDMKTTLLLGDLIRRLVPVKLAKAA
jgi:hypothetical protein